MTKEAQEVLKDMVALAIKSMLPEGMMMFEWAIITSYGQDALDTLEEAGVKLVNGVTVNPDDVVYVARGDKRNGQSGRVVYGDTEYGLGYAFVRFPDNEIIQIWSGNLKVQDEFRHDGHEGYDVCSDDEEDCVDTPN